MTFDLYARYLSLPVMQPDQQKIQATRPLSLTPVADLSTDRCLVAGLATDPIIEIHRFAKSETGPCARRLQQVWRAISSQ